MNAPERPLRRLFPYYSLSPAAGRGHFVSALKMEAGEEGVGWVEGHGGCLGVQEQSRDAAEEAPTIRKERNHGKINGDSVGKSPLFGHCYSDADTVFIFKGSEGALLVR